jgi:LCP family protein required for cell wall assembly
MSEQGEQKPPGGRKPPGAKKPGQGGKKPGSGEPKPEPGQRAQRLRGRPEYKVYRSRPSIGDRLRGITDVSSLRKPAPKRDRDMRRYGRGRRGGFLAGLRGRKAWWKWALIAAAAWLLASFLAFGISAQIQSGKFPDSAKKDIKGSPFLLAGQNILILGGTTRSGRIGRFAPQANHHQPPLADTIMVVHASLTSFNKLSVPRDSHADIPGFGTQKIDSALSITGKQEGDPGLMAKTVEKFLGIDINHVVLMNFDGFAKFINTIGGVTVNLPEKVCADVDGGKKRGGVTIKLHRGDNTLEGDKALALARTRENKCNPNETDAQRAMRQQLIVNGIKDRLTDPLRFPYNFIHGPFIGWAAPQAFVSDMGGFTLPQLAIAAIFGGGSGTDVLKFDRVLGGSNDVIIPPSECRRGVQKLLGGPPPHTPACSPG